MTRWKVVEGSSAHNTVEVFTNKKIMSTLDRVFINAGIVFCPKAILPSTTTSNLPPLPWCEPITHFNEMSF